MLRIAPRFALSTLAGNARNDSRSGRRRHFYAQPRTQAKLQETTAARGFTNRWWLLGCALGVGAAAAVINSACAEENKNPPLKTNQILERTKKNEIVYGHMILEFATRGIARIVDTTGADFVVIDMEHSGFGFAKLCDLLGWFSGVKITPVVRVPDTKYHFIARILDAGAQGIMIPNVKNPEQAKRVTDCVYFKPRGKRGLGLGTAHNDYKAPPDPSGYLKQANDNVFLICQIESAEAISKIEQIAAIDGVDCLWVGHFDLTSDMGILASSDDPFHHPQFISALKKVVAAAKKYGKRAGIQPNSEAQAKEFMKLGFDVISFGCDFGIYKTALKQNISNLREWKSKA